MSAPERVRQWARENRDPSILEVFRRTSWRSIFSSATGPPLAVLACRSALDVSQEVLSDEGRRILAIFVLAACYWITWVVPSFGTRPRLVLLGIMLVAANFSMWMSKTATRLLDRCDINHLDWDILPLMAGDLALGGGMKSSDLAGWLFGAVPLKGLGVTSMLLVLCAATLLLSTLMSNTAVANLLMPIAPGSDRSGSGGRAWASDLTGLSASVGLALGASLAMCLPVSTTPNAIAFASGHVQVRDFVLAGAVIGIVGVGTVTVLCRFILP